MEYKYKSDFVRVTPMCNVHGVELTDIGSGIIWAEDGFSDLSEFTCLGLTSESTDEEFELCQDSWYVLVEGRVV